MIYPVDMNSYDTVVSNRESHEISGLREAAHEMGAVFVSPRSDRSRRLLNVFCAGLALVVLAPLMLVIAILVRLSSPGPILFTQVRVGMDRRRGRPPPPGCRRRVDHGGRLFTIYKFRTMRQAERVSQVWAQPDDPRVTRVGGVLRKYRLDELPQLWNVLRGDMNLVGPRPEQPSIFKSLREQIDRYEERQQVLPGITGWAQVNQRYDTSVEDVRSKLDFDLHYIERCSLTEDVRILCRTVPVMIFRKGSW